MTMAADLHASWPCYTELSVVISFLSDILPLVGLSSRRAASGHLVARSESLALLVSVPLMLAGRDATRATSCGRV